MQKIFFLIFIVLILGCSLSYANPLSYDNSYNYMISNDIIDSHTQNHRMTITVNLLIIAVYVLYWLKQKP